MDDWPTVFVVGLARWEDTLETMTNRARGLTAAAVMLTMIGAVTAPDADAGLFGRKRKANRKPAVSREELKAQIEPGRLVYNNSRARRRLSFESIIKQTMDRRYSQDMLELVAKQFWAKKYRPVVLVTDPSRRPEVVEVDKLQRDGFADGSGDGRPPPDDLLNVNGPPPPADGGTGDGRAPPPGLDGSGTSGLGGPGSGRSPIDEGLARDLENGIHNEILRVMKEKGYNLVALNVFAQTMDLVKVILIVATKDLPDDRIRPTLREIRSIIENEVLAAKYPGVYLAELSSFTLLNERDNHFYEHPVLYWQLKDPSWQGGGGPIVPGTMDGEGPVVGGVASGPSDDYYRSDEFEPEEDFDEMELLNGPIAGF